MAFSCTNNHTHYIYTGSITVASAGEGHGSTFEVRLPMTRSTRLSSKRLGPTDESQVAHKKAVFTDLNQSFKSESNNSLRKSRNVSVASRCSTCTTMEMISPRPMSTSNLFDTPRDGHKKRPSNEDMSHIWDKAAVSPLGALDDASGTDVDLATSRERSISPPRQHLLVVDDSAMNRKMLCKALKLHGYSYTEATDGAEAVAIVKDALSTKSTAFDGILMDYIMPNMDGPTATEEIRKLGYVQPIIGVTGNALQSDIDHFTKHGASMVLIKPVQPKDLREVLEG